MSSDELWIIPSDGFSCNAGGSLSRRQPADGDGLPGSSRYRAPMCLGSNRGTLVSYKGSIVAGEHRRSEAKRPKAVRH